MDAIKQEVSVVSVSRYHMVDRTTGEINEGTTVRFIFSTDLKPTAEGDLKGYKFGKTSLPYAEFEKFGPVPGIYAADLFMNIASDGTVKVRAENFEYKKPLVVGATAGSNEVKKWQLH